MCKKAYRWSFFFWLDLISTISLLLDIPSLQVCTECLPLAHCTSVSQAQPAQCTMLVQECMGRCEAPDLDSDRPQSALIATNSSRNDIRSSILRAAVRAFQLIRVTRLLQVCNFSAQLTPHATAVTRRPPS